MGIGIAPSDTFLDFEPYGSGSFEIRLIGTSEEDVNASLSISGPLEKYFEIEGGIQEIKSGDSALYTVYYTFPGKFEQSGRITHDLRVNRIVKPQEGITASLSVVSRVVVSVPYPKRYVEYDLKVESVNDGENISFNFGIANRGDENIFGVKPNLIIYTEDLTEEIFREEYKASSLIAGKSLTRSIVINSSVFGKGKFVADSFIDYDGLMTEHQNVSFTVGYEDVDIINFTNEVLVGGIRKVVFSLENMWNNKFDDIYLEVFLEKNGVPYTERSVSNSIMLKPLGKGDVSVFLDVTNVPVGEYTLVMITRLPNSFEEERVAFEVVDKFSVNWNVVGIALLVIFLIIANILWLRHMKHASEKPKFNDKMSDLQEKLGK